MTVSQCDRCGAQTDSSSWDRYAKCSSVEVTSKGGGYVSGLQNVDLCKGCTKALRAFLTNPPAEPSDPNANLPRKPFWSRG